MSKSVVVFALLLTPMLAAAQPAGPVMLYLSPQGNDQWDGRSEDRPLRTLDRARAVVRSLKGATATVLIRGGVYPVSGPVVFRPEDSGSAEAPVTYRAYPGERPVFDGGRPITGWQRTGDGRWQVLLPDVREGTWRFRQLFINGEARPRARTPNEGFYRVAGFPDGGRDVHYHTDSGRFEYAPGDLNPEWKNMADVEVIVYHFWTDSHLPIASIDPASRIVTFRHKAGKVFTDDFTDAGARYVVENVYEALDRPGEWYLDAGTGVLTYLPLPGEDPEGVRVTAPYAPDFLRFEGDPAVLRFVEHLRFEGLTFAHTNWDLPPGDSNDRQGSAGVPAAVTLTGARHVAFDRCAFHRLGTFAFDIKQGSSHNRITGNEIAYPAAGGIRIGGGSDEDPPVLRTGNNLVADNTIHHYGEVFPSAVGILLTHTFGNTIEHNHIHHGYYTGISVGWEWGYQRSVSRDNVIAFNHIHDIGQGLLSDMGGIYTLGVSPGTVIRNNLIHDIDANHYGGWGMYNDEGSSHILIENNIVYHTKFAPYNIHFAREIVVRNNIFALGRIDQLSRSRIEPHPSLYFENNIVYWTGGDLLRGRWADREYPFHFHPKDSTGLRPRTSTFEVDYNVYYNPLLPVDSVRFGEETWGQWQARGKDRHSVYADPLFMNPAEGDFRLRPESPALRLGFEPIDMRTVGPRRPGVD